jgi:hypothetical protein
MIQDETKVNLRTRIQILDKTDENNPKIILSDIITERKSINNNIEEDRIKHD